MKYNFGLLLTLFSIPALMEPVEEGRVLDLDDMDRDLDREPARRPKSKEPPPRSGPDRDCYTLADGSCEGVGCMHDPAVPTPSAVPERTLRRWAKKAEAARRAGGAP